MWLSAIFWSSWTIKESPRCKTWGIVLSIWGNKFISKPSKTTVFSICVSQCCSSLQAAKRVQSSRTFQQAACVYRCLRVPSLESSSLAEVNLFAKCGDKVQKLFLNCYGWKFCHWSFQIFVCAVEWEFWSAASLQARLFRWSGWVERHLIILTWNI